MDLNFEDMVKGINGRSTDQFLFFDSKDIKPFSDEEKLALQSMADIIYERYKGCEDGGSCIENITSIFSSSISFIPYFEAFFAHP